MLRKELKRLIIDMVKPNCMLHGYRMHKSKPVFYKINDGIISFIFFETKSNGYECGTYIMPLYIPHETFVLDYGDRVGRQAGTNFSSFFLKMDMPEEEAVKNINNHIAFFEAKTYRWHNSVNTPEKIIKMINKPTIKSGFFTRQIWRDVAVVFSYFYIDEIDKGVSYLAKMKKTMELEGDILPQTIEGTIQQIVSTPENAEKILHEIVEQTISNLGV